MKRPVFCVALAFACGGTNAGGGTGSGADFAADFTGRWWGRLAISAGGIETTQATSFSIGREGVDQIRLAGVCADLSGPSARVTDASHLEIGEVVCPPVYPGGACSGVTLSIAKGSRGALSAARLDLEMQGTVTGCGQSFPVTYRFSGAYTGAVGGPGPPLLVRVEPGGVARLDDRVSLFVEGSGLGDFLKYHWELSPPAGSKRSLAQVFGDATFLEPDVAGPYKVTLRVDNGTETPSFVETTVVAGVDGPYAVVPDEVRALAG